jgi:hypothetical protein
LIDRDSLIWPEYRVDRCVRDWGRTLILLLLNRAIPIVDMASKPSDNQYIVSGTCLTGVPRRVVVFSLAERLI